jgi:excisionase family DNA binding protein
MKTSASKRARPAPGVDLFELETVWISVAKAAKRVEYSTRTVKRWITAGTLPATRSPSPKGRGHLRIRLGDLDSLIARGAVS